MSVSESVIEAEGCAQSEGYDTEEDGELEYCYIVGTQDCGTLSDKRVLAHRGRMESEKGRDAQYSHMRTGL